MVKSMRTISECWPYLVKGTRFHFANWPNNDIAAILLEGLKRGNFVDNATKIEHFRVLFGIPIHESNVPFRKIRWLKNQQLLYAFVRKLHPSCNQMELNLIFQYLFTNKNNKAIYGAPHPDKRRLEASTDYDVLLKILSVYG